MEKAIAKIGPFDLGPSISSVWGRRHMTRHSRTTFPLEELPLFASDAEIGAALLGSKRACEWKGLAPLYERQGFPKIDPVIGGRYVPAIKAFFDKQYGIATLPTVPDGIDRPETWKTAPGQKHRA
jgi:hypothetical protein